MPYPRYVPDFTADDIASAKVHLGGGKPLAARSTLPGSLRLCAWEWLCALFTLDSPAYTHAYKLLASILEDDHRFYSPDDVGPISALILWNDACLQSEVAKALNRLMLRLGYDSDAPEVAWSEAYLSSPRK